MDENEMQDMNYTAAAWDNLYDVVDSEQFSDDEEKMIYDSLRNKMKLRSFGDYLRRYIYCKAELTEPFSMVSTDEYLGIIRGSFDESKTPQSFEPTTAKLRALAKNWLSQQTVKRRVVFLLGFGLRMSAADVNMFLTKALLEHEINPKDPFEVVCWYCYKNQYTYPKFSALWSASKDSPEGVPESYGLSGEQTMNVCSTMFGISEDASLMAYLARLRGSGGASRMSVTARACFMELYNKTRDIIAGFWNATAEEENAEALEEYRFRLSRNLRISDANKQALIERFRSRKRTWTRDDITEGDIEQVICAAIPKDVNGNLTPAKASQLNAQFAGKRFSRQRMNEILTGGAEVSRFDLITLNFFVFSQMLDAYPQAVTRYSSFCDSTNDILNRCSMGELYVQNPYECFVLMCILSNDPLGVYADVWERSYSAHAE